MVVQLIPTTSYSLPVERFTGVRSLCVISDLKIFLSCFSVKPSDMIAELQGISPSLGKAILCVIAFIGRLPIRVELQPLTKNDFYRILTEPKTNLIAQHQV